MDNKNVVVLSVWTDLRKLVIHVIAFRTVYMMMGSP